MINSNIILTKHQYTTLLPQKSFFVQKLLNKKDLKKKLNQVLGLVYNKLKMLIKNYYLIKYQNTLITLIINI